MTNAHPFQPLTIHHWRKANGDEMGIIFREIQAPKKGRKYARSALLGVKSFKS